MLEVDVILQNSGAGDVTGLVKGLLSMHEAVVQTPLPQKPGMTAQPVQVPAFRKQSQEQQMFKVILELHSEFEARLGYIKPFSKERNK